MAMREITLRGATVRINSNVFNFDIGRMAVTWAERMDVQDGAWAEYTDWFTAANVTTALEDLDTMPRSISTVTGLKDFLEDLSQKLLELKYPTQ